MTVPRGQIQPQKNLPRRAEADQEKEAGEQKEGERLCREQAGQADERVHPEKTVEGDRDLVLAPIIRGDEEEEEKDEEEELKNAGKIDFHSAVYALTILIFSRFISPSPLLYAVTVIGTVLGLEPEEARGIRVGRNDVGRGDHLVQDLSHP